MRQVDLTSQLALNSRVGPSADIGLWPL